MTPYQLMDPDKPPFPCSASGDHCANGRYQCTSPLALALNKYIIMVDQALVLDSLPPPPHL